ncbi:MAG: ABC transporter ATP-binding protein [Opitutaceae bacterium]|jgi:ABC-2 type transport system ATP-binding protein
MEVSSKSPLGVSVANLRKSYGATAALRGLSFEARSGEIFGLLGPNGAGKTTALECILGLRSPDSGSIHIGEIDAIACPEKTRALVGAHLQSAALQDKITPREALSLFGSFYPNPASPDDLIARFGLGEKAGASFDSLSSGQRQRLFLALGLVNRPRLLVLDEPTAGLDPQGRRDLHAMIRSLRDEGCTILLSTHDLAEAESFCDRIAILHGGVAVAEASPADLIRNAGQAGCIRFTVSVQFAADDGVGRLPGVSAAVQERGEWLVRSSDPHATVAGLLVLLERSGGRLLELSVFRPSLDEVFLKLTGRSWPDSEEGPQSP